MEEASWISRQELLLTREVSCRIQPDREQRTASNPPEWLPFLLPVIDTTGYFSCAPSGRKIGKEAPCGYFFFFTVDFLRGSLMGFSSLRPVASRTAAKAV